MLHGFEPRYVPPDRKTITQHYIRMYEHERTKIMNAMAQGVEYYTLTTDAWTSCATESYVTHTVHYNNKMWNLCSHALS